MSIATLPGARNLFAVACLFTCAAVATCQQPRLIHIAMAQSFFVDNADTIVNIAADDFKDVLKLTTGLDGKLTTKLGAFEIADKLEKKQIDFGIFHAHEFAWVRQKHADLTPLLVAVNKNPSQQAYVIVPKSSSAKSIADLRGAKLNLPTGTSEQARIFVAKLCKENAKKDLKEYFGSIDKANGPVAAMDEVAREKAQATVVTTAWLEFYKENKGPTFTNQLRVLATSEMFPPPVIAYKQGALDQKTIDQFTAGLRKANATENGREMMKEWNVDAFEAPPSNYAKQLEQVLKNYPPPASSR